MDAAKISRAMVLVTLTIVLVVALFWIQAKFDGADRKAALGVVQSYRARGGWSIPELIDRRHPGKQTLWSAATQSSCMQHQRVQAVVAETTYVFMVDINGPSIHPGNAASEAVIKHFDQPRPAGSASAPAPAPSAP
jgi:hypothetical protein